MKLDRFVKTMLTMAVLLLAVNCTTLLNQPSDAAGGPPSFIEKGKDYLFRGGSGQHGGVVTEIEQSGWIKLEDGKTWININECFSVAAR